MAPPEKGTLTVTNENGIVTVYHLADTTTFSHPDGTNKVKFKAFPPGQESGLVQSYTLNFDKMTGYVQSWT